MARSYLVIPKDIANLVEFIDEGIIADAFIFHMETIVSFVENGASLSKIMELPELQEKNIYIIVDTKNKKQTFSMMNTIPMQYFNGWIIPNATPRLLNQLNTKVRELEQKNKMHYGSIHFFPIINRSQDTIKLEKIAHYGRVKGLLLDVNTYRISEGLPSTFEGVYLKEQVQYAASVGKKQWIAWNDSTIDIRKYIEENKRVGSFGMITTQIQDVATINDAFTPTQEEIREAEEVLGHYKQLHRKEKKILLEKGQQYSAQRLLRYSEVLENASLANPNRSIATVQWFVRKNKMKELSLQPKIKKFYTIGEEIGNAVTHGVGALFAIIGFILLWIKGYQSGNNIAFFSYLVYGFSAILLYTMSTLYHSMPLGSKAKRLFQRFDHMTIYLLIAGTYTPFTLLALGGSLGTNLAIFLWVVAFLGFFLKVFHFGKLSFLHIVFYLSMGWIAIFFIDSVLQSLGRNGFILLLAGGLSYTLGVLFYGLKLFKFTHMVWHFFVILGTVLHFLTIYLYL